MCKQKQQVGTRQLPYYTMQYIAAVTWQLRQARGEIPLQHNYLATYRICLMFLLFLRFCHLQSYFADQISFNNKAYYYLA